MSVLNRINEAARVAVYQWLFAGSKAAATVEQAEARYQSVVALARRYYDGNHKVSMTPRQQEWLRRAARQIGSEYPSGKLNLGFRVYRLEDGEPLND